MKNSGEAIDKVLAGLRSADAPEGMEGRILEAMQDRVLTRALSGWRWFRPIWLVAPMRPVAVVSLAGCVALVAMVAFVLMSPWIGRLRRVPARSEMKAGSVSSPAAAPEVASRGGEVRSPGVGVRSVGVQSVGVRAVSRTKRRAEVVVGDGNSLALDETRSASFPAPPMPLTEQERLLLRVVHRRDPEQLEALNPVQREARDAEEKAEVERFFVPAPTGANE